MQSRRLPIERPTRPHLLERHRCLCLRLHCSEPHVCEKCRKGQRDLYRKRLHELSLQGNAVHGLDLHRAGGLDVRDFGRMRLLTTTRRGFTLVETLVVLSIIGVLSALITTGIRAGIKQAKVSTCASNLSQVGKALELYCADSDEWIPPYYLTPGEDLNGVVHVPRPDMFVNAFKRYGVEEAMLFCPLDTDAKQQTVHDGTNLDHRFTSYEYSAAVWKFRDQGAKFLRFSLAKIPEPAGTVYLLDAGWFSGHPDYDLTPHGDSRNLLYFDGHTKQQSTHAAPCDYPGQSPTCRQ